MLKIKDNYYKTLSQEVQECIVDCDFFSGTITNSLQNIDYEFVSTLIFYRDTTIEQEGLCSIIVDVVPVWWELNTSIDGEELLNDFDFQRLKESICLY